MVKIENTRLGLVFDQFELAAIQRGSWNIAKIGSVANTSKPSGMWRRRDAAVSRKVNVLY